MFNTKLSEEEIEKIEARAKVFSDKIDAMIREEIEKELLSTDREDSVKASYVLQSALAFNSAKYNVACGLSMARSTEIAAKDCIEHLLQTFGVLLTSNVNETIQGFTAASKESALPKHYN